MYQYGETAILYALDTTDFRKVEEQLAQSQKMNAVGQLAGGVAHDFNNVLQAIIGYSDLLLANHRPTDPSFQDIMQIKQNATRAATLVRQLLAFSRRQTLRPQVLDLGDALSDLTMLLRRLIGEKVKLDLVHGRDLWPVKVDVSQFEQVIVNLAVNARDAMPEGGTLSVRTANVGAQEAERFNYKGMPAADYVLIEVTDTGTGIPVDIVATPRDRSSPKRSPASATARVRVTWLTNPVVTDVSDSNFRIQGRVTVTQPNAALTWPSGSTSTGRCRRDACSRNGRKTCSSRAW